MAKAIESALSQDYPNLEIIISDNCSTDGTDEVIRRYTNDPRVHYNRNSENIGMLPNYRKATYELSKGKYVTYVSSDDYLTDNAFVSDAVKLAVRYEDADLIYGRMSFNSTLNGVLWEMPEQPYFVKEVWNGLDVFFKSIDTGLLSWGACLMKRSAMEKVGCLMTEYHNADLDSNYKIILDSKVAFLNRLCYMQVGHTDNNGFPPHAGKLILSLECFENVAKYASEKLPEKAEEFKRWKEHFIIYTMNMGFHSLIERNIQQFRIFRKEVRRIYPELYKRYTSGWTYRKMMLLRPVKKLISPKLRTRLRNIGK